MISTDSSNGHPQRVAFAPLKPKRRCKTEESEQAQELQPQPVHEPVLVNARLEFNRHRHRIQRSGRPNVQWRRVTPPSELLDIMPTRARPALLARVVDKIKMPPRQNGDQQGVWSLLRCWVLAFR